MSELGQRRERGVFRFLMLCLVFLYMACSSLSTLCATVKSCGGREVESDESDFKPERSCDGATGRIWNLVSFLGGKRQAGKRLLNRPTNKEFRKVVIALTRDEG